MIAFLFPIAALLLCATVPPTVLLVPLFFWTRRLRAGSPAFVAWISYGLIALDALLTVVGAVVTLRAFTASNAAPVDEPSQKARALAEGISEAMNCGASAVMLAALVALWLAVWRWRLVRR